jgi:hypothetical protein
MVAHGLDLGPASIAIVPREAKARLEPLCAELRPDARAIRRMQRRMERQRRAANPEHYLKQEGMSTIYLGYHTRTRIHVAIIVCIILEQLASALTYIHLLGLLHRDIKRANILFDQQ